MTTIEALAAELMAQGVTGPAGPQGPQGDPGPQGPEGPQGSAGADGANGADGAAGADGATGADGAQGPTGPAGADGAEGPQGPAGPTGADGDNIYVAYASDASGTDFSLTASSSLKYIAVKKTGTWIETPEASDFTGLWVKYIGDDGATGATGAAGADGAEGPQGPTGATGAQGPAGADGADGADGTDATNILTINAQTANYTLVIGDGTSPTLVTMTDSSALTLTVPANAEVAFAVGTQILVRQGGNGVVTIAPDTGVTIQSRDALVDTAGLYAVVALIKLATNTWSLSGDLA